jgi:hypothetical protein
MSLICTLMGSPTINGIGWPGGTWT